MCALFRHSNIKQNFHNETRADAQTVLLPKLFAEVALGTFLKVLLLPTWLSVPKVVVCIVQGCILKVF